MTTKIVNIPETVGDLISLLSTLDPKASLSVDIVEIYDDGSRCPKTSSQMQIGESGEDEDGSVLLTFANGISFANGSYI